jgi:hypothetical protein
MGNSASPATREMEYPLERSVSERIGSMPFLWLEVDDPPSADSDRGVIESGAISLLSNFDRAAIDAPSGEWLGLRADRPLIRESGLWNVNHVQDRSNGEFLDVLERHVANHPRT